MSSERGKKIAERGWEAIRGRGRKVGEGGEEEGSGREMGRAASEEANDSGQAPHYNIPILVG